MKKIKFLTTPTRVTDLHFDDIDDTTAQDDWRIKAEQLQQRRWRKLRQAMR
jgi:hypothetical protein